MPKDPYTPSLPSKKVKGRRPKSYAGLKPYQKAKLRRQGIKDILTSGADSSTRPQIERAKAGASIPPSKKRQK